MRRLDVGLLGRLSCFSALAVLLLFTGCANPKAQREVERHEKSAGWAFDSYMDRELDDARRLAEDFDYMGGVIEDDAQKTDRDLRYIDDGIRFDFERFDQRQPSYGGYLEDMLRGKPERLEDSVISLFL